MNKPTLGSQIKKYREASGMTQENLAEILNLSRQAISKWESETARPSTENLIRLAELFQVDLQVFITGQENSACDSSQSDYSVPPERLSIPVEENVPVSENPAAEPVSESEFEPFSEEEQNQLPPEGSPYPLSRLISPLHSRPRRASAARKAVLSVILTAAIVCTFALSIYFIWRIADAEGHNDRGTEPNASDTSEFTQEPETSEPPAPGPVLPDVPDLFEMEKSIRYDYTEFSDLRVPASEQFDENAFSEGITGNFSFDNSEYVLLLIRVLSSIQSAGAVEPEYDVWAAYQKLNLPAPASGEPGSSAENSPSFQDCYLISRIAENCVFTDYLFGENFENVLGYDGVRITLQSAYEYSYNYYFAPDEQGIPKFTFMTSAPSFEADVDGDGMKEIICPDDSMRGDQISLYGRTGDDYCRYQVKDGISKEFHLGFSEEYACWILQNAWDYSILNAYQFDSDTGRLVRDNSCFYPEAAGTRLTFADAPSFSYVNERSPEESPGFSANGNPLPSDLTRAYLGLQELWNITGIHLEECYVLAAGDTILYSAIEDGFDRRSFYSFSSGNLFGENALSTAGISIVWQELAEWSPLKAKEAVRPGGAPAETPEKIALWSYNRAGLLNNSEVEHTEMMKDGQAIRLYLYDGSFFEAIVDFDLRVLEDLRGPYPKGFEH